MNPTTETVIRERAGEIDAALWAVFDAARAFIYRDKGPVGYDSERECTEALAAAVGSLEGVQSVLTREVSAAYRKGLILPADRPQGSVA